METTLQSDSVLGVLFDLPETARTMRPGDSIPAELGAGVDLLGRVDPEWIWLLKKGSQVTGVLVGGPCHGAAVLWRLAVTRQASPLGVARLLRAFFRDSRQRGLVGYMTLLDRDTAVGQRLGRILDRIGGTSVEGCLTLVAGALPREGL